MCGRECARELVKGPVAQLVQQLPDAVPAIKDSNLVLREYKIIKYD